MLHLTYLGHVLILEYPQ